MTIYAARCHVHPDRFGAVKTNANRLLVIHTSEGGETGTSAESLCSFMTTAGDRLVEGSNPPRYYGASYQYDIDWDRIIPAVFDDVVAYAAAGANHDGIHYCIPGKAGQTRAQWLDAASSAQLAQLASAMRDKSLETGIPLVRLTVDQIRDGHTAGYCGHVDINKAFGKTDHTDPGPAFPWDVLAALLAPTPPMEAPPMATLAKSVRILDTRGPQNAGTKVKAGSTTRVGVLRPPADWARAAIVDIGVAETEAPGFVTAWSGEGDRPGTSVQDYPAGSTYSNLVHVPISGSDQTGWGFSIFSLAAAHLIVELVGWDSVLSG